MRERIVVGLSVAALLAFLALVVYLSAHVPCGWYAWTPVKDVPLRCI